MKTIKSIPALRKSLDRFRKKGLRIGLVPTMGYFHEGHLSLMRQARKECDIVVVSLFVNPLQFGPKEDLKAYPRDLKRDARLASLEKVDILFAPRGKDLYLPNYHTYTVVEELSKPLCGGLRPGHFKGVTTVVAKLFNLIGPKIAYFGQKDYQQARIIQQMVRDLSYNIRIRVLPTVRESDGLALSSRNVYLSPAERVKAAWIYGSLKKVKSEFRKGKVKTAQLEKILIARLKQRFGASQINYAEIRDAETLERLSKIKKKSVVFVAVKVGKAKLIDNIIL